MQKVAVQAVDVLDQLGEVRLRAVHAEIDADVAELAVIVDEQRLLVMDVGEVEGGCGEQAAPTPPLAPRKVSTGRWRRGAPGLRLSVQAAQQLGELLVRVEGSS